MEHIKRRFLCVGVITAFLLSIAVTGVAISQPVQKGKAAIATVLSGEKVESNGVGKVPIGLVHRGHGFALNGEEFHVLRVHVIRAMHLEPIYVKALMGENASIEDIEAETENRTPYLRGYMRLGENHYRLANMSVDADETNGSTVFKADILGPVQETNRTVGRICITTMDYEGVRIGEGELSMDEGEYKGEYRVLLDMLPPRLRAMQKLHQMRWR
ncbi:MAG: hypothetical protein N2V75_05455 [Methanophagales archaeon]|nr:hypothetical protein [Methanophagales archaeon]